MSNYQSFYDKAMTSVRPAMDEETANYKAAMADQGLLSSTSGQGAIQGARQKYLASANDTAMAEAFRQQQLAENQRQYDATFGEGQRQYDTSLGEGQRQYNATFGEGQRQYNQNFGEGQRQYDRTLRENQYQYREGAGRQDAQFGATLNQSNYQFGVNTGLKEWEMLNAKALAQKNMDSKSKPYFPTEKDVRLQQGAPAAYAPYTYTAPAQAPAQQGARPQGLGAQLRNAQRLARRKPAFVSPQASTGGPIGDPKENEWSTMRREMTGDTDAGRALKQTGADNAAMRAIQMAQLRLQEEAARRQAVQEDTANDPWANITAMVLKNSTTDINPDDPLNPASTGFQAQAFPTQLMSAAQGMYGIDIEGEARSGNPKALAVFKMLYPQTWMQRLGGVVGADKPTGGYAESLDRLSTVPTQVAAASDVPSWRQNVADTSRAVWGMPELQPDASFMERLGTYAEPTGLIGGTAKTIWDALNRRR